jgi:hypothetical protein
MPHSFLQFSGNEAMECHLECKYLRMGLRVCLFGLRNHPFSADFHCGGFGS